MSELHLRGISTALALLDESLCNFELWAKGREAHGVLHREQNTLSAQEREEILSAIRQVRQVLQEMRDRLGLQPKVESVASNIWAWRWILMEPLQELEGRYLCGYGEPPADLVAYLDPKVKELSEHLSRIQAIASKARPPAQLARKRECPEDPREPKTPRAEGPD